MLKNWVIYLVGLPGVGKLTVARELARTSGCKVIENHYWLNPIFGLIQQDGITSLPDGIWPLAEQVRQAVLSTIATYSPPEWSFVFTHAATGNPEHQAVDMAICREIAETAHRRGTNMPAVRLTCAPEELVRRAGQCAEATVRARLGADHDDRYVELASRANRRAHSGARASARNQTQHIFSIIYIMRITGRGMKAYQMLESAPSDAASAAFSKLLAIMAKLRNPNGGCPWDLEQSFRTIVPHTIEEAYEVADAIEQGDMEGLKGELGDLLFQAVFYAQMAREAGTFTMADVLEALNAKMVKRHPHVFGDLEIADAAEQTHAWERQKADERAAAAAAKGQKPSALDGVTSGLPALTRAEKLQKRAARVGFDWPEPAQVLDKIVEEVAEIRTELEQRAPKDSIAEEIGDLLFAVVNLARHLEIDTETALRAANRKFERRFRRVEALLAERGKEPAGSTLDEMEAAWTRAKVEEG